MNLVHVRQQALALAPAERQELVHTLVASLETPTLTEVDKAWLQLAEARLHEIENGGETIPSDRFFADIRRDRGWQE